HWSVLGRSPPAPGLLPPGGKPNALRPSRSTATMRVASLPVPSQKRTSNPDEYAAQDPTMCEPRHTCRNFPGNVLPSPPPSAGDAFSSSAPPGVRRGSPPARRLRPLPSWPARRSVAPRPLPSPDVRLREPRLRRLAWRPIRPPRTPALLVGPPRARQPDGYG